MWYAVGLGREYGHKFVKIFMDELVQWDGVVQHNDVHGRSIGAFYWRR